MQGDHMEQNPSGNSAGKLIASSRDAKPITPEQEARLRSMVVTGRDPITGNLVHGLAWKNAKSILDALDAERRTSNPFLKYLPTDMGGIGSGSPNNG
jgi:hypothetical protein